MNKFTGETNWKYHTVNEPIETGFNDADTKKWGPSGVPVWSSPTIDKKRGRIFWHWSKLFCSCYKYERLYHRYRSEYWKKGLVFSV